MPNDYKACYYRPGERSIIIGTPACGAQMKVIAFITNYAAIDKIIHHLGITFTHERPPPPARQEELY